MPELDLIAIGDRIRTQRTALRLTQQAVYEKLDISQNHYSRIENGHVGMSFEILLQLSDLLGVTTDYILTGKVSDTDSCAFLTAYNRLSPKQRRYIEQHIRLFSDFRFE